MNGYFLAGFAGAFFGAGVGSGTGTGAGAGTGVTAGATGFGASAFFSQPTSATAAAITTARIKMKYFFTSCSLPF